MPSIVLTVPDNRIISEALVLKISFVLWKTWRWLMTTSFPLQWLTRPRVTMPRSSWMIWWRIIPAPCGLWRTLTEPSTSPYRSPSLRSKTWWVPAHRQDPSHLKVSIVCTVYYGRIKINHISSNRTTGLYTTTTVSLLNWFFFHLTETSVKWSLQY